MKSKRLRIAWIDDRSERKTTADDMEAQEGLSIEFYDVRQSNIEKAVDSMIHGIKPDLVIVDHVLDKAQSSSKLFSKGTIIAETIRAKWPYCPIVGVTAAVNLSELEAKYHGVYDQIYPFDKFELAIPQIVAIARGFQRLKAGPDSVTALARLLNPPESDHSRIMKAFPDDLKVGLRKGSFATRFYKWMTQTMFLRPGFLYGIKDTATFLGIKAESLKKIEKIFIKAKYDGIFNYLGLDRWWSSRLADLLFDRIEPIRDEAPLHAGRKLPGITPRDHSKCYVCGKDAPEIVGYIDLSSDTREPMHLACTVVHPSYKPEPFFDEVRMMKGRQ